MHWPYQGLVDPKGVYKPLPYWGHRKRGVPNTCWSRSSKSLRAQQSTSNGLKTMCRFFDTYCRRSLLLHLVSSSRVENPQNMSNPKSGSPLFVENCRPISLLCTTSKILEKLVYDKIIINFIRPKLSLKQHGFLKSLSQCSCYHLISSTTILTKILLLMLLSRLQKSLWFSPTQWTTS